MKRKAELRLSLLQSVFLVPTAVGSYNDTHAHTRTLTNTRTSTVVAVTKDNKQLKRVCCTVPA